MGMVNTGVPIAPGAPDWGAAGALPVIYSTILNWHFYTKTVAMSIVNRRWETAIKNQGQEVVVRDLPDVNVQKLAKNGRVNLDHVTPKSTRFVVDQAIGYGMVLDNIDIHQADIPWLMKTAEHAVNKVKIAIDAEVLQTVPAQAHAANMGATAGIKSGWYNMGTTGAPLQLDADNIISTITAMMTVLDEADIPDENRWVVLPHWARMLIKNSELKDANIGGGHLLRTPVLGEIDRAEVLASNQLLTVVDGGVPCTNILFGHKSAITYAGQIIDNKVTEPSDGFAKYLLGQNVYGFKVMKTESLGVCYATRKTS